MKRDRVLDTYLETKLNQNVMVCLGAYLRDISSPWGVGWKEQCALRTEPGIWVYCKILPFSKHESIKKTKSTWRILWIVGGDKEARKIGQEMDLR